MLQARPNMNGNTSETFRTNARTIHEAALDLEYALNQSSEVLHGRNYQTGQSSDAREQDVARLQELLAATKEAQQFAAEMFNRGAV